MTAYPALHIDNLSVRAGGATLFSGLSLSVETGARVTLAGPSGSGKSTLMRCILGFSPWTSGAIYIQNQALTAQSVWRLRLSMAYVGQEPDLGDGLVRDALTLPLCYRANRHLHFERDEAYSLFERLLLPAAMMNKPLSGLSGGEKQRVALVSALLLKRRLLLLDEAASALDGVAKQAVRDCLCSRPGITVLSVSHDTRDFALSGPVLRLDELARKTLS